MSSVDRAPPRILCTGIIVLDEVFRVDEFPQPDGKPSVSASMAWRRRCRRFS